MNTTLSYNPFEEKVEQLNKENESKGFEEEFKERLELRDAEDAMFELYSISQVQKALHLTESEALKLLKSGLIKVHRVGNEYRALKKSVYENKKIVRAMNTYKSKKTITVKDMSRILGLGKTASYRLIEQNLFKKFLIFGQIRIDVESFEEWYAGQFHYKKVNGEMPGLKYGNTISPGTIVKVLDVPKSTAYSLLRRGKIKYIVVDGHRRVLRDSFEEWLISHEKGDLISRISEVEKNES